VESNSDHDLRVSLSHDVGPVSFDPSVDRYRHHAFSPSRVSQLRIKHWRPFSSDVHFVPIQYVRNRRRAIGVTLTSGHRRFRQPTAASLPPDTPTLCCNRVWRERQARLGFPLPAIVTPVPGSMPQVIAVHCPV
jgi:hypothetical protein